MDDASRIIIGLGSFFLAYKCLTAETRDWFLALIGGVVFGVIGFACVLGGG